jgi:hypothetical protein
MAEYLEHAHRAWSRAEHDWFAVRELWRGVTRDHYECYAWAELEAAAKRHLQASASASEIFDRIRRLPRP